MSAVGEPERLARVRVSVGGEAGLPRLTDNVARLGAARLVQLLAEQPGQEAADSYAARMAAVDPGAVLERATASGMRFVVPGDDEWPVALDDLARCPPQQDRGGVPVGLWCRGPLRLDEAVGRAVAVVGSRSSTSYGDAVTADLVGTLAREGWTTISGAAFGIDYAAHRGAVAARGTTVAVLACGADRAYPRAHTAMIEHLAATGLVVSEVAPGLPPTRPRFLVRNRLIAALGRGTVVVEAAWRSGALNTASWTTGLGRVLMGVPGPVTSAQSQGVHHMLRTRDAVLVTRGEEVLELVGAMGSHLQPEPREPERPRDRLAPDQATVLEAVPLVRWAATGRIAATAGVSRSAADRALGALHRLGFVEHACGEWRQGDDVAAAEPPSGSPAGS